MRVLVILSAFFLVICLASSAKILVIFPIPAPSHYLLGSNLAKGLAEAGHDVTIISPFSEDKIPTFPNNGIYRQIVLKQIQEELKRMQKDVNMFDKTDTINNLFFVLSFLAQMVIQSTESMLTEPEVQQLLNSAVTFDAVIVQEFLNPVHKLFARHFKASLILFSNIGSNTWLNSVVGNPSPPSYVPDVLLNYSTNMTFFERLHNSLIPLVHALFFYWYALPKNKELAKKFFPRAPDLEEVMYIPSLVLLNSHESINIAVPKVPNMIEIGGYHVRPPKELPEDLKTFLDQAPHGVIYFSMGSNLKSANIHPEKRNAILKSLSKLKEKVLWKFEDENIHLPPNIMIKKWLPQSDILAHKNVKLFITHGGHGSTTETVYHGVPILAIPIVGDQKANAQNAIKNGIGLILSYEDITEENLTNKLNELLNNPKYRENAIYRSKLFHDRIVPPMKEAVYWVEYAIRHPNIRHLRVAGADLPWYKYLLLDVIAFATITLLTSFYIFVLVVRKYICKNNKTQRKIKQN